MIDLSIKVNGVEQVTRALRKLENLDDILAREMGLWAMETLDGHLYGMQNYAPPPAGSRYVRTGNLGANWGVLRPGRTSVAFTNATSYGPFVVGDSSGAGQAAIHAGRWWIALNRVEGQVDKLADKIEDAVGKAL